MDTYDLRRRAVAEGVGTAFLVAAVVGSGIMAERLTDDIAVALLANTIATGAILFVLISALGPVSGAHFNPAVTLAFALRGALAWPEALLYVIVQCAGGLLGTLLAHAMFELDLVQIATTARTGPGQWIAEGVATFGLVATILAVGRFRPEAVAAAVGLFITAGYWFTASTSFANPAVALARTFSDTFSGIRPVDLPVFVLAQGLGAIAATLALAWLVERAPRPAPEREEAARS